MQRSRLSRRSFLGTAAASAFGAAVVPRHVLGGPGFLAPSDTVNVAAVGAGGMGASNMAALTSQNIVAWADVDHTRVYGSLTGRDGTVREDRRALKDAYDRAAKYHDFREMLDREPDIEAVVVATPDHVHAIAAKRAMEAGKHVYVQKPLTYTVREGRVLRETAARTGVVTQMGNQGHSGDDGRRVVELVRGGAIGDVREVHVWTNRPRGYWPQGVGYPEEVTAPPAELRWDLWLGPAPERAYNPIYHPFNWRGWVDYGVGALGDMGAHLVDFPFWALEPGLPTRIETRHTPWGGPADNPATYPLGTVTFYEFGDAPRPLAMTWYDGGLMPPTPEAMPADRAMNPGGGVMYVGSEGTLIHDTYGNNPFLLPGTLEDAAAAIPQSLPRIEGGMGGHEMNWIRAIRGEEPVSCPFDYAVDLNETMLLGLVAARAGTPIVYDGANMRITNAPEANRLLTREYRRGWELEG